MLTHTLSPARRALRTDAANAFWWIHRKGNCAIKLLSRFDPWNNHAVGPDVEGALDEADI